MADNFAARKCDKYKVVSMLPDVCMTPTKNGAPTPYPITIKLKGSASVSENVNFNGNGAFLHEKSDTVKVKGDKPGQGKGIKSGTVGKKAESITSSPSVRINGKQLVRENDLFYMNNKNTIGKLTTTESGSASHITDDGKVAGKTMPDDTNEESLWENIKAGVANKWEDVKYNASHFNDPKEGFNAYAKDILGEDVAAWTTDSVGDAGKSASDSYAAFSSGDYKGAGIAAVASAAKLFPPTGKMIKAYEKGEDALDTADSLSKGELPSGSGKKKKGSGKKKTDKKADNEQTSGGKSLSTKPICGEVGKYKNQKKNYAGQLDSNKYNADHIPAKAYMKAKAQQMIKNDPVLRRAKVAWKPCLGKAIEDNGYSIIVPKKIHTMGKTYGVGEASQVKKGFVDLAPNKVANVDIKTYKTLLRKENPLNKKSKKLNKKEKQKLKDAEQCKKAILKGLKQINNVDHNKLLKDTILNNKDC